MKEEAPLGNPFIGEPRGGRPAKDGGRMASPCGHCPSTLPKGVVVALKRQIVEGKERKEGEGGCWPPFFGRLAMLGLHSIPTFILHFILPLSCSLH
jgi:hypothetical protein